MNNNLQDRILSLRGAITALEAELQRVVTLAGGVQLNHRQQCILEYLKSNPFVTTGDVAEMFPGFCRKTIYLDLIGMVEKGVLSQHSKKRGRYYVLSTTQHQPKPVTVIEKSGIPAGFWIGTT